MNGVVTPIANVIAVVLLDMFMLPIFQLALIVIVALVFSPVFSMMQVSCGKGKLFTLGVPPDEVAHATAFQLPPAARLQYLLIPALNVILVLSPRLPNLVPVHGMVAPAAYISWKSTSLNETDPADTVSCTPSMIDCNVNRVLAFVLTLANTPLIVCVSDTVTTEGTVGPLVNVRLL